MTDKSKNQGEGNKEADRHYREKTEAFVEKADVEKQARQAAKDVKSPDQPLSPEEEAGRERAAEFDPKVAGAGRKTR